MKLINKIKELKKRSIFNADNCYYKQKQIFNNNVKSKIEDIEARIKFVVDSTLENEVIYCIRPSEEIIFVEVKEHFINLGFNVIITFIEGLPNKHMIISWESIYKDNMEE